MAKGPKRKAAKQTRVGYRSWRASKNKQSHKDSEARRVAFYKARKIVCGEYKLGKADGTRKVRELQASGQLPKDLIKS